MQVAQSANKPMIIDEVNGQRPISARNDFLSRMFAQVQATGSPVVGEVSTFPGAWLGGAGWRQAGGVSAACMLPLQMHGTGLQPLLLVD